MSKLFSVIDIETNGGSSKTGKITEIAIFVTDGNKILSEYCTLVNPESYIPPFIEDLTGISNEMVEDAPKFYEIAKDIVEITANTVFVAHNARFDYGFIKQEFASLGYDFTRETLCTLSLSRKFFKGLKSYSLGNLCRDLGIKLENRHRAFGDAKATTELFSVILKYDLENFDGKNINGFPINGINEKFDLTKLNNLPEKTGIYYFYNSDNEVIHVESTKNIRSSILAFFRNQKNIKLKSQILDLDFELVGCELAAKIKVLNQSLKKTTKYINATWGIFGYEDENGYLRFYIEKLINTKNVFLRTYATKSAAEKDLSIFCEKYNLCKKLCGLYESSGECFYYGLGECKGACNGVETPDDYNIRADNLIGDLNNNLKNAYIILENNDDGRIWIISIKDYKYSGYGSISEYSDFNLGDIEDLISYQPETNEIKLLILSFLNTTKSYKIINIK